MKEVELQKILFWAPRLLGLTGVCRLSILCLALPERGASPLEMSAILLLSLLPAGFPPARCPRRMALALVRRPVLHAGCLLRFGNRAPSTALESDGGRAAVLARPSFLNRLAGQECGGPLPWLSHVRAVRFGVWAVARRVA